MQKYNTRWLIMFFWSIAFLFHGERAPAQSAQAILEGRITDQTTGDVIAGAWIIAKNLQTNVGSCRYSNEHGLYYFSALQPGMYGIRVDALGFQPQENGPLELTVASRSALNLSLRRRWGRINFEGSYTYGRTKDVQSDPFIRPREVLEDPSIAAQILSGSDTTAPSASNTGNVPVFLRQFDPHADYGNSDFDQTHNFVLNQVAELPRLSGWLGALGSWQLGALLGFRSGLPFDVTTVPPFQGGVRINSNRANFIGTDLSEAYFPERSEVLGGVLLLDPTKFAAPAPGQFGNLSRNALRGPGFWNVDLSIGRGFSVPRLAEGVRVQFRADFFNAFNHTNLGNPDSILQSDTFGQARFGRQGFSSALPSVSPLDERPRRIQFALRVNF